MVQYNRKGTVITERLNPLLDKLSECNGYSVKENMRRMGIPLTSKGCNTKQLSGYISKVTQELRKFEAIDGMGLA